MKLFKILASIIASFLILACLAFLVVTTFVKTETIKNVIVTQVYNNTGRQININGAIHWTVFPTLSLKLNDVTITNPQGFATPNLAHIQNIRLSLEILPLLHKKIDVDAIALDGANISLINTTNNQNNWQLNKPATQIAEPATPTATNSQQTLSFAIKKIAITDSQINYTDQRKKQTLALDHFNLSSTNVNSKQAFPIEINTNILFNDAKNNISLTLKTQTEFDPSTHIIQFSDLKINSMITNATINNLPVTAEFTGFINLATGNLQFDNVTGNAGNLNFQAKIQAANIFSNLIASGTLTIPSFKLAPFAAYFNKAPNMAIKTISFATQFNYQTTATTLSNLVINADQTDIKGNIYLANKLAGNNSFNLKINNINVPDFKTTSTNQVQQTTSATAVAQTNSASTKNINTTQNNSPSLLTKINLNGTLTVGRIITNNVTIKNLATTLQIKNGFINFSPLSAQIFNGALNGNIKINCNRTTPSYAVQASVNNLDTNLLYKAFVSKSQFEFLGNANMTMNITSAGTSSKTMLSNLNGNTGFVISNGVLKGINIDRQLQIAAALFNKQLPTQSSAPNQTAFQTIKATILFNNGVANNNDFQLTANSFSATGAGTVNLLTQAIDYRIQAKTINSNIDKLDQLQTVLGGAVPIKIAGTLNKPLIYPDQNAILQAVAKHYIQKNATVIQEKIKDNIGKVGSELQKQLSNFLQ